MDFKKLQDRLDQMVWLPPNWDGFETAPINPKVYDISKKMIEYLNDNHNVMNIHILVGVDIPGSLIAVVHIDSRYVEMVVTPSGTIDYEEFMASIRVGSGSFYLSKTMIDSIFN